MSSAEANRVAFAEAVRLLFGTWDTLTLAVQNEWGGPDSAAKADWMVDVMVDIFSKKRNVEQSFVEETLEDILSNEFNTLAQDGSVPRIAGIVVRLYSECSRGNHSGLVALQQRFPQLQQAARSVISSSAKQGGANSGGGADADDGDDDDDDDDDDNDVEGYADLASELDSEAQAQPPGAAESEADAQMDVDNSARANEPDPDGWQTVPARPRRK